MIHRVKTIDFFYREDCADAAAWKQKIEEWAAKKHPKIKIGVGRPDALIVLGGDGTILEAADKYRKINPLIIGLNLGNVGFLATIREPKNFLNGLNKIFKGKFSHTERMMLSAAITRNQKQIFKTDFLNEITVQNLLGVVELEVRIDGHPLQYIQGSGMLVSTPTGSTAYNLSAHGPIITPDIKCLVLTELMDHNIPTPSVVTKPEQKIFIKILNFRERGLLSISKTRKSVDVILAADGETIFPLKKGDVVAIKASPVAIKFAELEKNYFFKSLQEKFAFK